MNVLSTKKINQYKNIVLKIILESFKLVVKSLKYLKLHLYYWNMHSQFCNCMYSQSAIMNYCSSVFRGVFPWAYLQLFYQYLLCKYIEYISVLREAILRVSIFILSFFVYVCVNCFNYWMLKMNHNKYDGFLFSCKLLITKTVVYLIWF